MHQIRDRKYGSAILGVSGFPGRHFADCDRNGELLLVNGAFGAVTSLSVISLIFYHHTYEVAVGFRRQGALFRI